MPLLVLQMSGYGTVLQDAIKPYFGVNLEFCVDIKDGRVDSSDLGAMTSFRRIVKMLLVVGALLLFAFAGGVANLNFAVWRYGDDPAIFVDFFEGMIACLVLGSFFTWWIIRRRKRR